METTGSEHQQKVVALSRDASRSNTRCTDCDAPAPQWASVSFGVFICLNCSGIHRSLGVHISFVRSVVMDKWTSIQAAKMEAGGNAKWQAWCQAAEGWSPGMTIQEKYQNHFAAMYRDKLQAEVEGREWTPADTPAPLAEPTSSIRKPRNDTTVPYDSVQSASSFHRSTPSPSAVGGAANPYASRKEQNESFFAGLGAANASRPEGVSPALGGRYVGFGSGAPSGGALPGESTSSRAVPSFADLQSDPGEALKKGWGFLSSTLSQAGKTVQTSVVEPAAAKMSDPQLKDDVWSFATRLQNSVISASKTGSAYAAEGLKAASEQARARGYDVGDLGSSGLERYGKKSPDGLGNYASLPTSAANAGLAPTAYYDSSGGNSPVPAAGGSSAEWSTVAPLTAARNAAAGSSAKAPAPAAAKPAEDDWESW